MLLTECFWIKLLAPTTARQCVQGPGQGAIYNTISHTRRGYRHQNCSRLIILNGYREGATLRTAFSLALNQEGRGREGWAKCTAQANGKSKIIVFAFFIIQHEHIDGGRERDGEGRVRRCRAKEKLLTFEEFLLLSSENTCILKTGSSFAFTALQTNSKKNFCLVIDF